MRTPEEVQKEHDEVAGAKTVIAKYISRLVMESLDEDQLTDVDNITEEAAAQLEEIDSDILDDVQTQCLVEKEDDGDAS